MENCDATIPRCGSIEEALVRVGGLLSGSEHEAFFRAHSHRYRFVLRLVREAAPSGGSLLDAGASPGHISALCSALGYDVQAVDLKPAEQFQPRSGLSPLNIFDRFSIPVEAADISAGKLPFRDDSFSVVLFNETIEHLIGSPLPAVRELARVLAPGGRLIITTPNAASLKNRIRLLAGLNVFTPLEVAINVAPYKCHNREYTLAEVEALVRMAGLKPVRATRHNIGEPRAGAAARAARAVYYASTWLWPPGRSLLCVAATKK